MAHTLFKDMVKEKMPGEWTAHEEDLSRVWTCSRCGFRVTLQYFEDPQDVQKQIFAHMFDCMDRRKVAVDFPDITTLGQD